MEAKRAIAKMTKIHAGFECDYYGCQSQVAKERLMEEIVQNIGNDYRVYQVWLHYYCKINRIGICSMDQPRWRHLSKFKTFACQLPASSGLWRLVSIKLINDANGRLFMFYIQNQQLTKISGIVLIVYAQEIDWWQSIQGKRTIFASLGMRWLSDSNPGNFIKKDLMIPCND